MMKLAALIVLTCSALFGTTLTGSLRSPGGTGVTGRLLLSLSQQGALSNSCGGPAQIMPSIEVTITITAGAVVGTPTIYGNDCMMPGNLYYKVRFMDTNGNILFTDNWVISGTTLDIGTIISAVITGTTTTLGTTGFIQTAPSGNQTLTQPPGSTLSINNLFTTQNLEWPDGTACNASGCIVGFGGLNFNPVGNLYLRAFTGADVNCASIQDGWIGLRLDTHELEVCISMTLFKRSLI